MNKKNAILLTIFTIVMFGLVIFFTTRTVVAPHKLTEQVFDSNTTLIQTAESTDLFVHNAQEGNIEQIDENTYIITLNEVDEDVTYFTDRPQREAGHVALAQFLNGLGFEIGNPPNAAIVMEIEGGDDVTIVVELTEPIFNRDNGSLRYKMTLLNDEGGQMAEYGDNDIPEKFARATFLIDGCGKKGEKFCGATGQCYDPKKEKCNKSQKDSYKNHKDEKCGQKPEKHKKDYRMTLDDAYKIADGKESECLIYDDAKLSKTDFECKDDIWKIKMHTQMKGEQSSCEAYCIVVPTEKYKKGEGVARVEYDCKKSSDEKEPKNKYCPKPDLSKGHDAKDATGKLIDTYQNILKHARDNNTSYEHHYCVTTGMPYATKKHWATDCSGLGGYALFTTLPYHYKLIDDSRSAHKKADRPLAEDFYDYIKNIDDKNKCWERVKELKHAKKGDFLVVKYDKRAKENSTGHVMWIDKAPQWHDVAQHYEIEVIDSANSGHGDDTRNSKNTYNCKGSKDCGIGRGKMTIYSSGGKDKKDGEPIKYKWNTKLSSVQYVPYKKDCPDNEKCRLEGIVIGRVKNCEVKK